MGQGCQIICRSRGSAEKVSVYTKLAQGTKTYLDVLFLVSPTPRPTPSPMAKTRSITNAAAIHSNRRRRRELRGVSLCLSASLSASLGLYVSFSVSLSDLQSCGEVGASDCGASWLVVFLKSGFEGVNPPLSKEGEFCGSISFDRDVEAVNAIGEQAYGKWPCFLVPVQLGSLVGQVKFRGLVGGVVGGQLEL